MKALRSLFGTYRTAGREATRKRLRKKYDGVRMSHQDKIVFKLFLELIQTREGATTIL